MRASYDNLPTWGDATAAMAMLGVPGPLPASVRRECYAVILAWQQGLLLATRACYHARSDGGTHQCPVEMLAHLLDDRPRELLYAEG